MNPQRRRIAIRRFYGHADRWLGDAELLRRVSPQHDPRQPQFLLQIPADQHVCRL